MGEALRPGERRSLPPVSGRAVGHILTVGRDVPPLSLHAWLRYDAIARLLPPGARTLLEIGAGQGSAGALLAHRFEYVGLEPDETSFETARRRIGDAGGTVLNERAETYTAPEPFDVVCALEVLEHLEDDAAALAQWKRHIGPRGWLLLSVPAGRKRFGSADGKAGHFRRYDRTDLASVVAQAGYVDIEILSYGFPLGYALEAGRNLYARRATHRGGSREDRTAASGRWLQPPEGSGRMLQALSAPFRRAQRPFARTNLGTGLVARARLGS